MVNPTTTVTETRRFDDELRRFVDERFRTDHPSLLGQLELEVRETPGRGHRAMLGPRVPINLTAFDILHEVRFQVFFWFGPDVLDKETPASVETGLLRLAELAPTLVDKHVRWLDDDVRRWWGWARLVLGWEEPAMRPHVPCINCERWDTLRIHLEKELAMCVGCREVWDADRFGILAAHYKQFSADRSSGLLDFPSG